ncbi:hypothetical protein ACH4XT_38935 [Streptomyces avidinii]
MESTYRSNVHVRPFRLTAGLARQDMPEDRAEELGRESGCEYVRYR